MSKAHRCETCRWWAAHNPAYDPDNMDTDEFTEERSEDIESGECRRFPPAPRGVYARNDDDPKSNGMVIYGTDLWLAWPGTQYSDWCGEWVTRRAKGKAAGPADSRRVRTGRGAGLDLGGVAMTALERLKQSIERNRAAIESALLAAGNCRGASTIESWLRLIDAAEREAAEAKQLLGETR